jgi:hypothetical protein
MSEIEKSLFEVCEKYNLPQRHTDFQIEHFIIGKECSIYGKMWQCIRELQTRKDTVKALDADLIDLQDNLAFEELSLKELQYRSPDVASDQEDVVLAEIKQEKHKIEIKKQTRKVQSIENSIQKTIARKNDVLGETAKFLSLLNEIINDKSFVDINDPNAQLEFWNSKFHAELNLTAMLNQPINSELVKSVLAMPNESVAKIQLQNALGNISRKLLNTNK